LINVSKILRLSIVNRSWKFWLILIRLFWISILKTTFLGLLGLQLM
jgi:hypothetical protein